MNNAPKIWSYLLILFILSNFLPNVIAGNTISGHRSCNFCNNRGCNFCKNDCKNDCKKDCNVSCNNNLKQHNNNGNNLGKGFCKGNKCFKNKSRSCDDCSISFDCCLDDCNKNDCKRDKCDDDCVCARTIFIPRALSTDSSLDLPLGNYQFWHHTLCPEDRGFFTVQASYFHRQSRKKCELAGFFLPNCKRCINIEEDGSGDIGSLWLELISAGDTRFSSTVCISPRRKVDGGFFNFYFDFNSWLCGSWLSIAFAAARAEHDLCLAETPVENEGTLNGIETGIDALNNPNWTAGRFNPCRMVRTGVDDVQFKLGWNYYFCNFDHIGIYFVASAPTGCRTRNEFLFEPFVGTRHGSVGVGLNTDYTVWDCCDQGLHWMLDLKYRFVLKSCERRVFDLCNNGPFSRYLQVVTEDARSLSMPGVNFFAQFVDVQPGSTIDFWTALHYYWCDFHFEFGYDLFWKDREKVCLKCPSDLGVGIYDISGDCLGNPVSASTANITQTVINAGANAAVSDAEFVELSTRDLDIRSGTHPRSLTNTVYGAVAYNAEVWCMPVMLGFIGSFEFAKCNTAFEQWGVQVKAAVSF